MKLLHPIERQKWQRRKCPIFNQCTKYCIHFIQYNIIITYASKHKQLGGSVANQCKSNSPRTWVSYFKSLFIVNTSSWYNRIKSLFSYASNKRRYHHCHFFPSNSSKPYLSRSECSIHTFLCTVAISNPTHHDVNKFPRIDPVTMWGVALPRNLWTINFQPELWHF